MKRQKALYVTARPPYPLDTGAKIRSWHVLAGLAQRYNISILTYSDPIIKNEWLDAVRDIGVTSVVQVENHALNNPVSPSLFLRASIRGLPATALKYTTREFTRKYHEMLSKEPILAHIENMQIADILHPRHGQRRSTLLTMNSHNVECQIAERLRDVQTSLPRKVALTVNAYTMRRFEAQAYSLCDLVLSVSREDADIITMMTTGKANTAVIENGVDETYYTQGRPEDVNPDDLVFVGSMDWLPNADGMEWFVQCVFPMIKTARTQSRLHIVGRNPMPSVKRLHAPERGVYVTGTVSDVRPYLRSSSVVVVPLRFGGGTRLKILEAFSMGKAVLSTTLGCEGISCEDGKHLLIRDTPESMAAACLKLMNNRDIRESLGAKAKTLASTNYAWPAIINKMNNALDILQQQNKRNM
ncbi:hypothetical protein NNJEOMEG_01741 [Fundidesulfovibrio magnetotacticus]|uniref:Glycosyltransferase n=1 Tax=Fundidesulfovibrio magnetotacticus TaxID=2730080 RepID=A0A6V8LMK7_9BACT|nr:glycosyltransferase [Fundidesulfovibrio magnetotacticus]GFK93903.1 hypothetical protein NNJEOMEG_01741 [Fundidesulfovibrio magnetotacticus]